MGLLAPGTLHLDVFLDIGAIPTHGDEPGVELICIDAIGALREMRTHYAAGGGHGCDGAALVCIHPHDLAARAAATARESGPAPAGPEPERSFLMEKMVEVERATQEELQQDLKSLFQGAIRVTLEMVLEEELKAMVGARRFERVGSRKDHRNGTYLRRLLTSLGQIDVMVPRSREGGSPADVMGATGAGVKKWTR